ncbi:MAG TPA: ABC transporter ATP-binding protein [Alphaproteobacteria bacterium]|nr:ABC transporter ATP-binding protein [Alphaproteobacteria bacterium]
MANNNAGVPPTEPVLQIDQFSVSLPSGADRQFAIEDISLQVAPREILCIVGESGSGKSVTAHGIMGLLPTGQLEPVGGTIHLLGESLLDATSGRLQQLRGSCMSMIFQEPMTALNPVMTLGRQIEEVLAEHTRISTRERMERTLNLMESVNLPDPPNLYRTYPHQISGGQRQRVMIAMALALEPALLIADEPTTALDVTTQAQILTLISNIQREHNTGVLFITHDFGVVAEIADRVAVMKDGKIVETGPTKHVLGAPKDAYTRMLIAAVPSLTPRRIPSAATKPIVLATDTLSKTYHTKSFFGRRRTVAAVQKVTIKIRQGETLGVVGESGAGKSTVARCVARLIEPTNGQIYMHNENLAKLSISQFRPWRKRIQIVFQDPYRSLNPRRTIGDAIAEGPKNFGATSKKAYERTSELLDLVGIDPTAADRYPHQFSGGQRQRVCIARALAMEPELLVADEPVSALDVSVQAQVLNLLTDIQARFNLAILFITHDLRVAAQISDHIAVMYQGEIVEQGPASHVFANPTHDYTKRLFNAAPGRSWDFSNSL